MKKIIFAMFLMSAAGRAFGYDKPASQGKIEIRGLLSIEASRPEGTPEPGQAFWDELQTALAKIRSAQELLKAARSSGEGEDPARSASLARAAGRLSELEDDYIEVIYGGVRRLSQAINQTRFLTTHSALSLKEREVYALLRGPLNTGGAGEDGTESLYRPRGDSITSIQETRKSAHEFAVKAEAMLAEGQARLQAHAASADGSAGEIEAATREAALSLERATASAASVSARLRALLAPEREYAQAISKIADFGGLDGTSSALDGQRESAVKAINEVSYELVLLEYRMASTVKETLTLYYMMSRWAKLEKSI